MPTVSCQVEDPATPGTALTGQLTLGRKINLVCTLEVTDGIVQGLHIFNLRFASNRGMKGIVIEMLDENGCLSNNRLSAMFYSPEMTNKRLVSVNGEPYNSSMEYDFGTVVTLGYVYGPFHANAILNTASSLPTNQLAMAFEWKMSCLDIHSEKCTDQERYCRKRGFNTRAKRSALTASKGNMTVLINLDVPPNTAALLDTDQQITQEQSETPEIAECDRPTFLWMLAAIFGVLLLLVVVICAFLALRLRRERSHKERALESNGH
ncbi:hypothetical protein ACF0H5_004769 [Mactra antiquata]